MHRLLFRGRKGFTLAELLVVVAVLALFASIVLVNLRGVREGAERSRAMRDAATGHRLLVCGYDQMMDLDGNRYNTVEIGGICWMVENLRYLPSVFRATEDSTAEPRYYVYGYDGNNVDEARAHPNFQTYGVLYNHRAAMTACPPGTRLPTDEEFHILERTFATGACDPARVGDACHPAGAALKVSTFGGNNSSGFSALSAGVRWAGTNGSFFGLGLGAAFWSSSESGSNAWYRGLAPEDSMVERFLPNKGFGFSVRCVR